MCALHWVTTWAPEAPTRAFDSVLTTLEVLYALFLTLCSFTRKKKTKYNRNWKSKIIEYCTALQDSSRYITKLHSLIFYFCYSVKDGKYIAGGFENHSKPVDFDNLPAIGRGLLPEDWDQFSVLLNEMLFRIPELVNVEVDRLYNSPESFTPDGRWLVGESAEVSKWQITHDLLFCIYFTVSLLCSLKCSLWMTILCVL